MKSLQAFFKKKETYLGIIAALAFQMIFFSVWLTAYDGVMDRTDQLKVAVINEDQAIGEQISDMIEKEAPFDITQVHDFKKVQKEMDQREWNMVIHIPDTFSRTIQNKEQTTIHYYINQSNPTLSKQMMETAATTMTKTINDEVFVQIQKEMADDLPKAVAAESPDAEVAEQMAGVIIKEIQDISNVNIVHPSITKTNDVEGFKTAMIPLMVVLASFIGAMILSQQLQFASASLKHTFNKWSLFLSRQIINLSVALSLSIITLIIMKLFNISIESSVGKAWLFQSILFFSFLTLSQIFVILFGNPGMVFNIALVAIQLASSGALVPRELLSSFYQKVGDVLPATYGVNGYFSLIYGGGDLRSDSTYLLMIIGITLLIAVLGVAISSLLKKSHQPKETYKQSI